MTSFFIIVFAAYGIGVLILCFGWAKLQEQSAERTAPAFKFLSVIVPFRNEEKNLPTLLESITRQSYPKDRYELILVNDHSENASMELPDVLDGKTTILSLPQGAEGKKAALDWGIRHAKGEIIVTTDADCTFPGNWLQKINESISNDSVKMVVGAVRLESDQTFFARLQALEFASLVGVAGATIGLGRPTMCNGANLAFKRSAFAEVNGYEGNFHIPSGDDEFLMRKISARWKNAVRFLPDPDAVVSTMPKSTLNEFISQRLRWAGKWRHNTSLLTKALALFVFLFHATFVASLTLGIGGVLPSRTTLFLLSSKFFVEVIFLFLVTHFLRQPWRWLPFLGLQILYPVYVIVTGLLSQTGSYEWKSRRMSRGVLSKGAN